MYKKLFLLCVFTTALLTLTQFAGADYTLTNGSATEPVWVAYSVWRPAGGVWPEGFRTQGWAEIEPEGTLNLQVPAGNQSVYIRVERAEGEVKPPNHATRERFAFWIHPWKPFTVAETPEGDFLRSNRVEHSLDRVIFYKYRNGGSHTVRGRPNLPVVPAQQIYDQSVRSVVWIINLEKDGEGSGVLIDEERKLVVTNQHVTDNADLVIVCFPKEDRNGRLIDEREYYTANYLQLGQEGYATAARVVAEDAERDIAILQLDFLREESQQINHDLGKDLSRDVRQNETVHLLGNPGSTELWHAEEGSFWADDGDRMRIIGRPYDGRGSSGGPVLNIQGKFIGIIQSGTGEGHIWAVPARHIKNLLDTVGPKWTFRIENDTPFTIRYQIKWRGSESWEQNSVRPGNSWFHWWNRERVLPGYPIIRFDSRLGDQGVTNQIYTLDPFLRYFGTDYASHVTHEDAYAYYFHYTPANRKIDLYFRNNGCLPIDVNEDGSVNLKDLDFIASRFGSPWAPRADVNADGRVDVNDLLFAAGLNLECLIAAAPSLNTETLPTLTAENLRLWIEEARQLETSTPISQKGVLLLERLLATVTQVEVLPKETVLLSNYPNPFNPETWIPYKLSKPAEVTVAIYAMDGRLIRTLALGHQPAGVYENKSRAAYWDGKNELGEPVASGVYFYTLTAGEFTATRKMLIRK